MHCKVFNPSVMKLGHNKIENKQFKYPIGHTSHEQLKIQSLTINNEKKQLNPTMRIKQGEILKIPTQNQIFDFIESKEYQIDIKFPN